MKKNLVALLLVLVVVSFGLFAAPTNPSDVSFKVETTVPPLNMMKITAESFNGTTDTALDSAIAYGGTHTVSTHGSQASTFTAYLTTLSNNRTGYKVTMTATAMKSTLYDESDPPVQVGDNAYINYTVTVNNKAITTAGSGASSPESQEVVTAGPLAVVASQSNAITLSVDETSFLAAVEGYYVGTVTFNYQAN